jgi:DNA-binding SARP family transcriptional activator
MEFRILGPLEVQDGDRLVPLGGLKERGLLALLVTRAGEVISRERLIDELWAGDPPASAVSVFQTYLSHLRAAVGKGTIQTHQGGYGFELGPHELDLKRFEDLVEAARESEPRRAAGLLHEALSLWRGPALADFAYESFAQAEAARLEELRLVALEWRMEAELALGYHDKLIAELQALVSRHPLREHTRGLLMLALYRSGRQAEALDAYRATRALLDEELGIQPSEELQGLERAILQHDPSLELHHTPGAKTALDEDTPVAPERSLLLVPTDERNLEPMLEVATALAVRPPRELILARLVRSAGDLRAANTLLNQSRDSLQTTSLSVRTAAFTSSDPGHDVVTLASEQPTDLLLLDAPPSLVTDGKIDGSLQVILDDAPCDVALLAVRAAGGLRPDNPVMVPFTGAEDDWSAIEIAAWMSRSLGTSLILAGTAADPSSGRRDASRLLARASLLVQQAAGVSTDSILVEPGHQGLISAAETAGLLIIGLSPRWRQEGLSGARLAVVREAQLPTLVVRRGVRPGGLAPKESITRFTWTLAAATR